LAEDTGGRGREIQNSNRKENVVVKKIEDGIFKRKDRSGFYISWVDARGRRRRRKTNAMNITQARMARNAEVLKVEQTRTLGLAPPGNETFKEVTEKYLKYQKPRITRASYDRVEVLIRLHLTPFFNCSVANIHRSDVQGYVTRRTVETSAASVTKELTTIKHMLSLCVEWELIPFNPAQGVKAPRVPAGRMRYLQPTELKVVIEFCPEWLRPIVAIAVTTGMRRSEILGLRWIDVDHPHSRILLPQTKNGDGRIVYLSQSALAVVESLPGGGPLDKVFPDVRADYVTGAFKRACGHAKIEDFHFHDLRHTAASWMRMAGADIHTVAQILGHKDMRMAIRYQHLSPAFLADAVNRLDTVFGDSFSILRPPSVPALPQLENPSLIN
jgi:integrase